MIDLTPKQQALLDWWRRYTTKHGQSPTLREAAAAMNVSTVTVLERARSLARKGVLRHERYGSYALPDFCPVCRRPLKDHEQEAPPDA